MAKDAHFATRSSMGGSIPRISGCKSSSYRKISKDKAFDNMNNNIILDGVTHSRWTLRMKAKLTTFQSE
jgi:hypothetical protein